MASPRQSFIASLLVSLILGAGAGVVASVLTSTALDNYANALLGERGFTRVEPRKPNATPADYQVAVRQARELQSRSLAVITAKTSDTRVASRLIGPESYLGLGVVVSANGWVLTTVDNLSEFTEPKTQAEVWIRNARYPIGQVIEDELSDYVLLKLTGASGLSPVGFGASQDLDSGEVVFVIDQPTGVTATNLELSEAVILTGPQTAETFVTAWQLATAAPLTGPVISQAGELLGFAGLDFALPLHHGLAFVQEVIRSGATAHAGLGAYVIDLSQTYNLDLDLRQGVSAGVILLAPVGKLAVPAKTPAALAGLKTHDIITAVDDQALTPQTSLSEILATYDPGQNARFSILRAGALLEISVVLGDVNDLVY